jgi:hypothetical protein
MMQLPYLAGVLPTFPGPLARYLPPIQEGVGSTWLKQKALQGSWVLDPFGAAPRLCVEAARAGYRVLVSSNNPIDRFLLELVANPPSENELRRSLADLGAAQKGDQRIEPHLKNLYATICNNCQQEVSADAYIWDRGANHPSARIYRCPNCGESGEFPTTAQDEARLTQIPSSQLHRSRALERVTPLDDPDRNLVEEALDVYLTRSIYSLFTLVNKLDSLPAHQRRPISALLLAAFDQASTLWPYPAQRARPRQLTVPVHFRENNVWLALEEAVMTWSSAFPASLSTVPVTIWPQQPPESGGICVFEGRLRDLAESWSRWGESHSGIQPIAVNAGLMSLPRPNQAYWTLSALWSGWLWGREAAARFKLVLRRRRYDWNWHCTALHAVFENLERIIPSETPILALIGEAETGFISAALLAASLAGLKLTGIALRQDEEQAQIEWQQGKPPSPANRINPDELLKKFQDAARQDGQRYLREHGEPVSYLQLHTATLAALASQATIEPGRDHSSTSQEFSISELFTRIQSTLPETFSYRNGFSRLHGSASSLEAGQWWLRETELAPGEKTTADAAGQFEATNARLIEAALADRVEIAVVRHLINNENVDEAELTHMVLDAFRGLHTPDHELIRVCLESYAEKSVVVNAGWRLRQQDQPRARQQDITAVAGLLQQLGNRLDFQCSPLPTGGRWITWQDAQGLTRYAFYLTASAVLGEVLTRPIYPVERSLIVYPGGRAALIRLKLRRDNRLQAFVDQGWRFVKFRNLRRLSNLEHLNIARIDESLALDPMVNQDPQISFI